MTNPGAKAVSCVCAARTSLSSPGFTGGPVESVAGDSGQVPAGLSSRVWRHTYMALVIGNTRCDQLSCGSCESGQLRRGSRKARRCYGMPVQTRTDRTASRTFASHIGPPSLLPLTLPVIYPESEEDENKILLQLARQLSGTMLAQRPCSCPTYTTFCLQFPALP